jgi:uncharacterized protein YggE
MRLLRSPVAAATLITLSSLAITPAIAQVAPQMAAIDGTILDISATGKTTRVPDLATISAGVVTQAPTAAQALADNAQRMTAMLAALKSAGIAVRDVQTSAVSLQPQYRYQDNKPPVITGYQASNTVTVRFRDIAKAGPVLDALVAVGANQISGPDLSLAEPAAALDEARVDAIKQARARAELYAKAAGLSVVRIVAISEGELPVPRPMVAYNARSAGLAAPTPIAPGESDVTVTVSVRFLLK